MKNLKTGLTILLVIAAIAAILQVLALCLYAFPHADDYVHIVTLRAYSNTSLLHAAADITRNSYLNWNARWATAFARYLVIGSIDAYTQYPVPLILFALIHLFALFAFFAAILEMGFIRSVFSALILYGVLLASSPWLNESTYWLTSVMEYGFGLSCGCLLFALIRVMPRKWISTAVLAAGVLFVTGLHEFDAVALVLIFATVFLHQRSVRAPDRMHWLVFLVVAILGLAIMALAPGTRVRAVTEDRRHGMALIQFVAQQPFATFTRWISSAPFLLAAFVWAQWVTSLAFPSWLRTPYARRGIPALTVVLALVAVEGAPIMSGYQPARSLNWGYFILVTGTLLSLAANQAWISVELGSVRRLHLFAMLSLTCALILSSNIELARRGLSYPRQTWRKTMIARIQFSSDGDVVLPAVIRPTPLLNSSGILDDKNHWLNRAFAQFLRVRSVVPEKECGPPQ